MDESVVDRIFKIMKEKKITQQQLADYLGVGQSTVATWKKRDCPPPINYLTKISQLLGVSIDYLATGSNDPQVYKLSAMEQFIIREIRTASPDKVKKIFEYVLGECDENYMKADKEELWKSLHYEK